MIRLIIILIFFFPTINFAQDVKIILSKIPNEEKQALIELFYALMQGDNFSYSLLGDKPISFTAKFTITPYRSVLNGQEHGEIFWKRWGIWKKYENFFSISQYMFIVEPSKNCPQINNIIFINKKAFKKKVKEHLKIFREILGKDLTPCELLKRIEETREFVTIIKNNEMLWGILLGYGLHNAQMYDRKLQIEENRIFETLLLPSSPFSSIDEEYKFLDSKLIGTNKYYYTPLILPLVGFAADPHHAETIALMKKYKRLQAEISKIYAKGDFLEIILSQLIRE